MLNDSIICRLLTAKNIKAVILKHGILIIVFLLIMINLSVINVQAYKDRHEIVFIEDNIVDYEILMKCIRDGVEVYVLDSDKDGLTEIAQVLLDNSTCIDAIHIISHGIEGQINTGKTTLNSLYLSRYEELLAMIGTKLEKDGDILLYGCHVAFGEMGEKFINDLAEVTGKDIAASVDATGNEEMGGNWALEMQNGSIEAQSVFTNLAVQEYKGLLAAFTEGFDWSDEYSSGDYVIDTSPITSDVNADKEFTISGTPFILSASAEGDGSAVRWWNEYGENGSPSLDLQSGGYNHVKELATTEQFTIKKKDGTAWTLYSIWADKGEHSQNAVFTALLDGSEVESQICSGTNQTLNFNEGNGVVLDTLRISGPDFRTFGIDALVGDTNAAPIASNVQISGTAQIGQELTGSYTYSDEESDPEGTSIFKWYCSIDDTGTNKQEIAGETGSKYTLAVDDKGKYISFEVTPVASAGCTTGSAVESTRTGPVAKSSQVAIEYNDVNKNYGDAVFIHTASGGSGTGTFNYTSSDTAVATINEMTGSVTILKAGTTTITATKAADATYEEASKTCTLAVNQKLLTATASANNKTYDGTTDAIGTIILTGVVEGDDVSASGTFEFEDVNVGTEKSVNVTDITLKGTQSGNYTVNTETSTKADISNADIGGISFSDKAVTYDGTEKAIEISGTLPDGTNVSYTNNTGIDAGEYEATATITGANYNTKELTGKLTIEKAELTATATADDKTYDGTSSAIGTIILTGVVEGDDVSASGTFEFEDVNVGTEKSVNVTDITLKGTQSGNYTVNTETSTKADISNADIGGISFSDKTVTYDGTEKAIEISGTLPDGTNVSYTNNTGIDAGEYEATATITGANYNTKELTGKLTIEKAELTATATADDKTYDGTSSAIGTIILTGVVEGDDVSASGTFEFEDVNVGTEKSVNVTDITLKGTQSGNYTVNTETSTKADISNADIGGISFSDKAVTYDGTEKAIEISGTLPDGTNVSYTNNTGIDAGEYEATATITGANYNTKELTGKLTIEKAELTATATADDKTYDGTSSAIGTIILTGVVEGDDVSASGTFEFEDVNVGTEKSVNVTDITLKGTQSGNYTVNTETSTKADISNADIGGISFSDKTVTYDGTEKAIEISGTLPDGTNVSYTNNTGIDAGEYEATATITGANYNTKELTGKLTIEKAELTATATADDKTYDGTSSAIGTIILTGVVEGDDVSASGTFEFEDANAGTEKKVHVTNITLDGDKSDNYTLQNTTATAYADIVPAASYKAEIAAGTLIPQAGEENIIEVTVKNSSGETDTTFGGNKSVTVTGYEAAPIGTYGKIGGQKLKKDSTQTTVTFSNGIGSIGLILNKADEQEIAFNIEELSIQQTDTLTVTPTPRTAAAIEITQEVEAPSENGGRFAQQPEITLKDPYGNICTDDDTTRVTVSKEDHGSWTLTGTTTQRASKGVVVFTDLGTKNEEKISNAKIGFNAAGLTKITSSGVTLPAPDPPGAPTIQAMAGDEEVFITWDSVSGATSYKVEYYDDNRTDSAIKTETTEDTSITIKELTNGTTYNFIVKAVNAGGESPASNEVSATPQVPAPGAPKLYPVGSEDIGDGEITLHWSEIEKAKDYTLYQGTQSKDYSSVRTVSGISYTVRELTNGTTYYFAVRANNPGGASGYSNEISAAPMAVPEAPSNIRASAGNRQATISFTEPSDNGGSSITQYIVTASPGNITAEGTGSPILIEGLNNGTKYTFTVKAVNEAGSSQASASSNAVTPRKSSGSSGSSNDNDKPAQKAPKKMGAEVLVNGKAETVASVTTTQEGNKRVTTVTIDDSKLEEKLKQEGNNAVLTIPVHNADVAVGQLNGQTVKNMEEKEAVLEIKTEKVTYTLPVAQINIDSVSEQMGAQVELKDIKVEVTVSEPSEAVVKTVEDTAGQNSYQVVVEPMEFKITCTSGDKKVDVSRFNGYVERMIAIPDGIDASKITTGIALNKDGTFSHVPTTITLIDGKYYAKINSLTNSTYSVIYSPKAFKDVENHWAKEAVNDMGSRLVINGLGNNQFEPNRNITRAEFAAILVKGLGLMRTEVGTDTFRDVTKDAWYYDAVSIAYENGLLTGYGDKNFGPKDKVTREQAMTMIKRAMELIGVEAELTEEKAKNLLKAFVDSPQSSKWARESIAACVKTGIITGKDSNTLAPKDKISRAEAAVVIRRLLKKSELI